jgi:hypothetical protein
MHARAQKTTSEWTQAPATENATAFGLCTCVILCSLWVSPMAWLQAHSTVQLIALCHAQKRRVGITQTTQIMQPRQRTACALLGTTDAEKPCNIHYLCRSASRTLENAWILSGLDRAAQERFSATCHSIEIFHSSFPRYEVNLSTWVSSNPNCSLSDRGNERLSQYMVHCLSTCTTTCYSAAV